MFEILLNKQVVRVQSLLTAKYGETQFVTDEIRRLTAQARQEKCVTCFQNYQI